MIPSDVELSSDTGEDDAEYEGPAAKTPRSASKTKAASEARQLIYMYKYYRVDPQLGSGVHFIFSPGKFQAPYFMCALANFTEIS